MNIKIGNSHISGYILLFLVMITPYLLPYYANQLLTSSLIRMAITYSSMLLMFLFAVRNYRYVKSSLLLVVLLYVMMIISTVMNRADISSAITESVKVILICATISIVITKKSISWDFVLAVKYFTLFFWVIHIVLMFLYPRGIPMISQGREVGYYLYGNVNSTIKYIFPGMCCCSLIDIKEERLTMGTLLFLFGILYQFFAIYHSATMIVAVFFIVMWLLCYNIIQPRMKQVYFIFLIAVLLLEVSIVVITSIGFINMVTEFFNKSSDFSGRNILWQRILYYIYKKPIWGYGMQDSAILQSRIGNIYGSHNYFLDIIYQGGVIGGIIFLMFVIIPLVRIRKSVNTTDSTYIVIGYVCGFLLMFLMEPFYGLEFLYMPVLYAAIVLSGEKTRSDIVQRRVKFKRRISLHHNNAHM